MYPSIMDNFLNFALRRRCGAGWRSRTDYHVHCHGSYQRSHLLRHSGHFRNTQSQFDRFGVKNMRPWKIFVLTLYDNNCFITVFCTVKLTVSLPFLPPSLPPSSLPPSLSSPPSSLCHWRWKSNLHSRRTPNSYYLSGSRLCNSERLFRRFLRE